MTQQTMKMQLEQAAERRITLHAEVQELLDAATETQRLSKEDEAKVDELLCEVEDIGRFLERHQSPKMGGFVFGEDSGGSVGSGPRFVDQHGNQLRAFTGEQQFANKRLDGELGAAIHGMLTGQPMASQAGSTDSAGGYILNGDLSSQVIDLARSASVCMRAGAVTMPMTTSELRIARVASDATSYWRPETAAVTSSTMTFEAVNLRAKTLACIVPVSIEMLEDASNAASVIESALAASMAQKLDAAGLVGTGAASEPLGIRNHSGINTIASVGTPADYNDISLAVGDIMAANYAGQVDGLSWISSPRTDDTYDGLQDTTNQPLMPTPRVAKLKRFSTTALPEDEGGGSDEAVSIVGDFSQLVFGMRTRSVNIRILEAGTATDDSGDTWNAASQLLKHIVCYVRADVALLRPTWFTVLTGITA
ncbi:phage major capsid protein [Fuerstiella marisgermanici]|uniref:Phage major capsid protein, HK97 family n=1 Tax=Fuerstiella marisgermanici TaxID=1891926 RepID=A0A1P8W8Z4_9PLAN|nr:phage major capsid protein [Fuerstiella marisgermanici]APZ90536.1 phage major capsid protein, HK97 family [Fuerstiella marisgermanici]